MKFTISNGSLFQIFGSSIGDERFFPGVEIHIDGILPNRGFDFIEAG
jgi:hypothetical protein